MSSTAACATSSSGCCYALSFSLVLIDVDQLRASHPLGREATHRVLIDVGEVLRSGVRAPDFGEPGTLARRIRLLLPETSLVGARQSVTWVRERAGSHAFEGIRPDDRLDHRGIVTFPILLLRRSTISSRWPSCSAAGSAPERRPDRHRGSPPPT